MQQQLWPRLWHQYGCLMQCYYLVHHIPLANSRQAILLSTGLAVLKPRSRQNPCLNGRQPLTDLDAKLLRVRIVMVRVVIHHLQTNRDRNVNLLTCTSQDGRAPTVLSQEEMIYLNQVTLPIVRALTCLLQKSSYLTLIQPLGVPLSLHYFADLDKNSDFSVHARKTNRFAPYCTSSLHERKCRDILVQAYLHGEVIWTLLVSNLQTGEVGVLDGEAICLLEVLHNRLHCAPLIHRETVTKEHHFCRKTRIVPYDFSVYMNGIRGKQKRKTHAFTLAPELPAMLNQICGTCAVFCHGE